jgi:AcrR family transcriptional regulator
MARPRSSPPRYGFRGTKPEPDVLRRNPGTQRAILAAAAHLVRRQGYNRVTIEAVAAEAGAGKQTIYRWWKTKAALFADVLGNSSGCDTGRGTPASRLARLLNGFAREIASPLRAQIYAGLIAEAATNPAIARAVESRLIGAHAAPLIAVLKQARSKGAIRRSADIKMAAEQMLAAVWFQALVRRRSASARMMARLVSQTLAGLTP